jgi:hypothetical protein
MFFLPKSLLNVHDNDEKGIRIILVEWFIDSLPIY